MRRRHQIVSSSSDEEEEAVESVPRPRQPPPQVDEEDDSTTATLNFQTVSLNSTAPPSAQVAADCAVGRVLQDMGLRLRAEWLQSCIGQLEASVPGFSAFDSSSKAKLCFKQFLYSDMNFSGAGGLPPNVHTLQSVDLKGPFVLQVDEIINISCPLRGRYQEAPAGIKRCLKLSMIDGIQRVFGMEYRPLKGLNAMAPAGIKVSICNVSVRHGLLLLVPEVFEILGGMVDELEGARQRLVVEANKPPRGKRTRNGDAPPLATRSTLAAWPQESATASECPDTSRSRDQTTQFQGQGALSGICTSNRHGAVTTPIRREEAETDCSFGEAMDVSVIPASTRVGNFASRSRMEVADIGVLPMEDLNASGTNTISRVRDAAGPTRRESTNTNLSAMDVEENHMLDVEIMSRVPSTTSIREDTSAYVCTESAAPTSLHDGPMDADGIHSFDARLGSESLAQSRTQDNVPIHITTVDSDSDALPPASIEQEIHMFDELDHPFVLSGDKESPFTYLASLSAKLAGTTDKTSCVKGKIKCFLTGVKGFQFKNRSTYELRVFVDDGSLISEILIDHSVVHKEVGYTPAEVTNALASSDQNQALNMKKTMNLFQRFLVNFEGTMVVEIREDSPVPIATEMNQGCPASDAWLLLRRLSSSPLPFQQSTDHNLSPIDLSP
ncbi:unnamed protein product [Cuscuta campestris]|uniref:RecQ-mediated genome instability protein 1 n=2 Tax=Cuscuta sect. Cleistogrammica TaxID=1824901 RepID=A0A484L2C5_9ASTE|nr:hypothetical protein DM860_011217 [Cuscuta australis]VFQ70465.1 unnamed protein product [Cuscuta campestris]